MFWPLFEALAKDGDIFQEFNRLQQEWNEQFGGAPAAATIPVNVYQNDQAVVVSAELPGVAPEDIKISVDSGVLTVEAESKPLELGEEEVGLRQERRHGVVRRQVKLPFAVDEEGIVAQQAQGVLTVTLPRAEASKPREIKVEGA